ncbi:MAG: hypothetical protein K2P33_06045 [Acutalibacter sp.]|nr:hypothetical protein [Acutalibacter sp.]
MKRIAFFLIACLVIFSLCSTSALATENSDVLVKRTVEVLDNGDSIVTELYECEVQPRSGKTGYASATYLNALGSAVWKVTVTGTFTYNGTTSSATNATTSVSIYNSNAKFVSKNASTSGNTATGTATVTYNASRTTRSASVSCDKNGNLY